MLIRISRVHYPVTVLGPGKRLGIWLQGCSLACKGCVSKDTWDKDAGTLIDVNVLVENCRSIVNYDIDGITITGGEPFEQPEALEALLDSLEPWRSTRQFDVLCYSGKTLKQLQTNFAHILPRLDFLIPEPFIESKPTETAWLGSANQKLLSISELAQQKLANCKPNTPSIQIQIDKKQIWFIGIPRRGDMERLKTRLQTKGILMENVSWL